MSKNFINYLKETDENTVLYIGTEQGSGWIVIETVRTILDNLEKLEQIIHDRVVEQNSNAKELLEDIPFEIVGIRQKLYKGKFEKSRHERALKNKLAVLENSFYNAFIQRKMTEKRLHNWIVVGERKVINTYMQDPGLEVPGICVILEGCDNGTIWFKGEKEVL